MALPSNSDNVFSPLDPVKNAAENPGKVFSDLFTMGKYTNFGSTKMWGGLFSGGLRGMGKGMYEDAYIWTKTVGPFFRDYVPGYQEGTWTGDILKRNVNDQPEIAAFLGIKIVGVIASIILSFFGQTYSWAIFASLSVSILSYATSPGVYEAFMQKLRELYGYKKYQDELRQSYFSSLFSGDIWVWLPGGLGFNAAMAGGALSDPYGKSAEPEVRALGVMPVSMNQGDYLFKNTMMFGEDAPGGRLYANLPGDKSWNILSI